MVKTQYYDKNGRQLNYVSSRIIGVEQGKKKDHTHRKVRSLIFICSGCDKEINQKMLYGQVEVNGIFAKVCSKDCAEKAKKESFTEEFK